MTLLTAPPEKSTHLGPNGEPLVERRKSVRPGRRSTFIVALLSFVALNLGLSFYNPINFDPYRFPYQGWAWWTFNDLRKSADVHNVAVMGSSLMVSAVSCCDANFLNRKLDLTSYHKASYLDSKLKEAFGGSFKCYNLSGPGQMPSDAYLTLKSMLVTAHRPDVVIYGVAPRDFIDSRMNNPTDSEPFSFLSRLVSVDECASGLHRDPLSRLDWLLQRNVYLLHHSLDIQMLNDDALTQLMGRIAPVQVGTRPYTYWERAKLMPNYKPGEIHESAIINQPTSREAARTEFRDNTAEYVERYRHPDRHTYNVQFYFLRKLAQLCKKERIELILVNMPITKENIAVLKPETYLKFVYTLQQFAFDQGINAFDLNEFNNYSKDDYHDYVHLNAFGGFKLFDSLVKTLKESPRTKVALEMAGQELARYELREKQLKANTIQTEEVQNRLKNTFGTIGNEQDVDPALRTDGTHIGADPSAIPN